MKIMREPLVKDKKVRAEISNFYGCQRAQFVYHVIFAITKNPDGPNWVYRSFDYRKDAEKLVKMVEEGTTVLNTMIGIIHKRPILETAKKYAAEFQEEHSGKRNP